MKKILITLLFIIIFKFAYCCQDDNVQYQKILSSSLTDVTFKLSWKMKMEDYY